VFSGIVEAIGTIRDVEDLTSTRRFWVEAPFAAEVAEGDSVAVDGACLTAVELRDGAFAVDVIGTTLTRTVAGTYAEGSAVNLERALRAGSRIDGHIVQGHIDGTGRLEQHTRSGEFWTMDFRLPTDVAALTVPRGSVTINGVSLTVAEMQSAEVARIGVIPFTHEHTNLGRLADGAIVNVEGDLIGKYVGKLLAERGQGSAGT